MPIKEVPAMRRLLFLLTFVLSACGGTGDGFVATPEPVQHVPVISNLKLSPDSALYMQGDGSVVVTAEIAFRDAGRDIQTLWILMPDGTSMQLSESFATEIGTITEDFALPTNQIGEFSIEIWLVDKAGDSSVHRTADFTVIADVQSSDWTNRLSGLPYVLNDVTSWWGKSKFVAVGGGGAILTSPDGIAWTQQVSGTDESLNAVRCDPYACFAVGGSGTVLFSEDGENWDEIYNGPDNVSLQAIHIGLRYYIAAGKLVGMHTPFMMRYDVVGDTWTEVESLPQSGRTITGIASSGGINPVAYVATLEIPYQYAPYEGRILTSSDGLIWVEVVISAHHESTFSILHDGNRFWAGGTAGNIYSSPDGANWTEHGTPAKMSSFLGLASFRSTLVAHGVNNYSGWGDQIGVTTSDGGESWQTFHIDGDYDTHGLAFADGRLVSVGHKAPGEGAIFTTP
jgi:hypothetical protein